MQFSGTVDIRAPRDRVWAFLIDPTGTQPPPAITTASLPFRPSGA